MHAELPAAPSTDEGIPATRLSLIKNGVLENLEYSRFWAQEKKREPTPGRSTTSSRARSRRRRSTT